MITGSQWMGWDGIRSAWQTMVWSALVDWYADGARDVMWIVGWLWVR